VVFYFASLQKLEGPTAPVKKEEEEAGADVRGLVALPTGLHGCRPTTMTLYGSLGQVRISVAALGADFLDEVGGHLHKKPDRAYTKAGPYTTTTTTIPISPYLAWGVFR